MYLKRPPKQLLCFIQVKQTEYFQITERDIYTFLIVNIKCQTQFLNNTVTKLWLVQFPHYAHNNNFDHPRVSLWIALVYPASHLGTN